MKIQPIVEGYGDVRAVPGLLRRLFEAAAVWDVAVAKPIRWPRHTLATRSGLVQVLKLARKLSGRCPVLVLLDSDDDCPAKLAPELRRFAEDEAEDMECAVVLAHREYEAWFLASIESLRGTAGIREDATPHPDPERPRDAKKALEERMLPAQRYLETAHQALLTHQVDLGRVYQRSRSFRALVRAVGKLLRRLEREPETWPPAAWKSVGPSRDSSG